MNGILHVLRIIRIISSNFDADNGKTGLTSIYNFVYFADTVLVDFLTMI